MMIATGYTLAGVMVTLCFSLIGCCLFCRSGGAYDDNDEDLHIPKKYAVVIPTDA